MKKSGKRWLAMLLAAVIAVSNVPTASIAYAENIYADSLEDFSADPSDQAAELVEDAGSASEDDPNEASADETLPADTEEESQEEPDSTENQIEEGESPAGESDEAGEGESPADGSDEAGEGESPADESENAEPVAAEEAAPEEEPAEADKEEGAAQLPYGNYAYGDACQSGNFSCGVDDEGNEIPLMFEQDLDAIIRMAEEGMELSGFFKGTLFEAFTLDDLYRMKEAGFTFNYIAGMMYEGNLPDWVYDAILRSPALSGGSGIAAFSEGGTFTWPSILTANGVESVTSNELGYNDAMGSGKYHGTLKKLKLSDGSSTYSACCLLYGGSFRSGYSYHQITPDQVITPSGSPLSSAQQKFIEVIVNVYEKTMAADNASFAAIQLLIWYFVNHEPDTWVDMDAVWDDGIAAAAYALGDPVLYTTIQAAMGTAVIAYNFVMGGEAELSDLSALMQDKYPGKQATLQYWACDQAGSQWVVTWTIEDADTVGNLTEIPYIDNFYMEKEGVTKHNIDLTKESVITNELLEGIEFKVVESEANGFALDYDIETGTLASYGTDYPDATTSTFGQHISVTDPVPYMDDDILPSGGQHQTTVTTDVNGHASTTFVHRHTFREFYSICYNGSNQKIDKSSYDALWENAFSVLETVEAGDPVTVVYKGETQEMTEEQIQAIYDSQQVVYTQTQEEAQATIDYEYSNYVARTYTYTVTELDSYTRPAAGDSNGNALEETTLPKEGYRKDIADVTTISPYAEVVPNGGTMVVGGTNDSDANTSERNVTDEPWYNQIFINKTDLETGSQILYDTCFDIYEYYAFKAKAMAAAQEIYPALLLNGMISEHGSALKLDQIASASLAITDEDDTHTYMEAELDVARMVADIGSGSESGSPMEYAVSFTPESAGEYRIHLILGMDASLSSETPQTVAYDGASLADGQECLCKESDDGCLLENCPVCSLMEGLCGLGQGESYTAYTLLAEVEHVLPLSVDSDGNFVTEDGSILTVEYQSREELETEGAEGIQYKLTASDGTVSCYYASSDKAMITTRVGSGTVFVYCAVEDTGITVFSSDGGQTGTAVDGTRYYHAASLGSDGSMTLTYYYGESLANGSYEYVTVLSVSANQISFAQRDTSSAADINDYTTWGQDNYEVVRVTADIARKMGWSDATIGMYTVHRLGETDQYCGTTFSNTIDESDKSVQFGYYEYGTLYYTQANLGHFCIVETTAPSDGSRSGYLGNYEDRDYTKLSEESAQKNQEGDPYATDDQMSKKKLVHYIHLCVDTNQYATYMLTDGYTDYDEAYYANFVETLDDPAHTETVDGYDAQYYGQSSLKGSIGLERFTLEADEGEIRHDVLNQYWDEWMNAYLTEKSGIAVHRDSQKTDTYFALRSAMDYVLNFVGTTIAVDSYDDALSSESEITYNGTYTGTQINYHSYADGDAGFLNARDGFNGVEYLQVGTVTYDGAEMEKDARYHGTEKDVSREKRFAFIDERTYGFIRFTKYDAEAERYVSGTLDDGYEAGTDHGDADLDGAIYSLYVSEENEFDVDYFEGALPDGTVFWAQPLSGTSEDGAAKKTGGFRIIYDGDGNADNGFTDADGSNRYEDYPNAYFMVGEGKLYLDYTSEDETGIPVELETETYRGIQHPDGMYGGSKHNGWYAVMEEQQVFVDADADGYGDTWTLQDVTLEDGAKVASAAISDGELQIDGLYLGDYYLAEEIRDSIVVWSTDNDDGERSEKKWLSFAPGYLAATDDEGNPVKYGFTFLYEGETLEEDGADIPYEAEQAYVQKETSGVSMQQAVKGAGFQINKQTTDEESASSGNTQYKALEGAGFTVFLISELSLIVDGTVKPAFNTDEGNMLVHDNDLVALLDETGNFVGYQFTEDYIVENEPFTEKYGTDYDLDLANRLIYVAGRGYYYAEDILGAYRDQHYSNETLKWDFTGEERAIARMYEDDEDAVSEINAQYAYQTNALNSGSPCEWYGLNGLSDGWVGTGVKNEYRLSELFTNHYGHIKSPELPWGAYIVVETTTPQDVFTVDPFFVTVSDSSAAENRSRYVTLTDTTTVASLVLAKRDAQSGQTVVQEGISFRIWDYQKNNYLKQYLIGPDGDLSMIQKDIFTTDEAGRLDAVASLEKGYYRLEEISGPDGFYNAYWDQGNPTEGETLGGVGKDAGRLTEDNKFLAYFGTVEFEVTTERRYKSSGIVSNGNLDYIYIGEAYYNDEAQGKLTIMKTGEVLVGYAGTDGIEYADEYADASEDAYNALKASAKDRSVFEAQKEKYDLGRDDVKYRIVTETVQVGSIQQVEYLAVDANGVRLAAVYRNEDGDMVTMNGGTVYSAGILVSADGEDTYYPGAYGITSLDGEEAKFFTREGEEVLGRLEDFTEITEASKVLMIVYSLGTDVYGNAWLEPAKDTYIYTVSGEDIMSTAYVVTDDGGKLTTLDYGELTKNADGSFSLTYTEAYYDPDINYNYLLTLPDGTGIAVRLVTYGLYIAEDGALIRLLPDGGYSVTDVDGSTETYDGAKLSMTEANTGETYDFVYEERPLANATYRITAAEDIYSQDGNGGTWFKEGDTVATVTTGEDGEVVSFAPAYKTAEAGSGSGSYDYTYYYGNTDDTYTSKTGQKSYAAEEFATTGSIRNDWTDGSMADLDMALYGHQAFDEAFVYPNTYYKEQTANIMRRLYRSSAAAPLIATDYVNRLEKEGNITTDSAGVLTETEDGYRMTWTAVDTYAGAELVADGDYYLLALADGNTIEVKESQTLYRVTSSNRSPWEAGDMVEKTAAGYRITHTDEMEAGVSKGALTDGAADLGYTKTAVYPNASIKDDGDGSWTLYDEAGDEVVSMRGGILVTSMGGYVEKASGGWKVTDIRHEDMADSPYADAELTVRCAELTLKSETYHLVWDSLSKRFMTALGSTVELAEDYSSVTVTTGETAKSYSAFDLLIEYDLHYASKEDIVRVEKDGTLGTVSVYLPLGKYQVQEIATPYGFLINDRVQTVDFDYADQIKEIVFNTNEDSTSWTDETMGIWKSKGLQWLVGGVNTVGEKLLDIADVNRWTFGTYGDAEVPYYADREGFLTYYDLRVKAWSQPEAPEPNNKKVRISKQSLTSLEELPGASLTVTDEDGNVVESWVSGSAPHEIVGLEDGTYKLTETTAPDGYEAAESICFTVKSGIVEGGTVVMYDAPTEKGVYISKKDIATGEELPGAKLILTDAAGNTKSEWAWTSGEEPYYIADLADGEYTLTEITAPSGYEKAESIVFSVESGVVKGGTVTMYDAPEGKLYVSKQDITTKEELPGAQMVLKDSSGKTVDSWTSGSTAHLLGQLEDGKYTLYEITAPTGYERTESITFSIADGKVAGGAIVMYDEPSNGGDGPEDERKEDPNQWNLGVGIFKSDADTGESLGGAKFGLYTSNDIYNVDGKLLVQAGTKLAVATTDETGFANFAVDIALMSRYLDEERSDADLIYRKTVTYAYESLIPGPSEGTYWLTAEACDTILLTYDGTAYRTADGLEMTIDTEEKTVTYLVEESIDGNTAVNTGDYYIQEITPPDGYLIDDTIYPVSFRYDDEYTMYIPVYAAHANIQTEVGLTKLDLGGIHPVEGAVIACYKIKDVNDVDTDGLISHEDDNLILIDQWDSDDQEHTVQGLLLSNREWPRLNGEEVFDNIYVFRELIPAAGYVSARDIEFKLYQLSDEDGNWMDADGKLYGYEVALRHVVCDQDYLAGQIIAPNENADDWILDGKEENDWDYSAMLEGMTIGKWLLVNGSLIIYIHEDATSETVSKALREADFKDLEFDAVYIEFGGEAFQVDFYPELQVEERPEDSRLTYTQGWGTLEDSHIVMYDDVTKAMFSKQDIVTGADVIGAALQVIDAETGSVIDAWVTGEDGYDEDGKALPHYIEGVLAAGREYILKETAAPTEDGYVVSNSVQFRLLDSGEIQHVIMEDDFTKLEISKSDVVTGEELAGAQLELWTADADGKPQKLLESWISGSDGMNADRNIKKHYVDYLTPGNYVLVERAAPQGYLVAENVAFTLTETGILQKVKMEDSGTNLSIYKYRTGTNELVAGATIDIYEVPEEYISYLGETIRVDTGARIVGSGEDGEGSADAGSISSEDLSDYISSAEASNAQHGSGYTMHLLLQYSITQGDLQAAGYRLTQTLPEELTLNLEEEDFGTEFKVQDGDELAFSYLFGKSEAGDTITVAFERDYVDGKDDDAVFRFEISADVIAADALLRANGSLRVSLSDSVELVVDAGEIEEIGSSVDTPVVTMKLTEDDLRATIVTDGRKATVTGLLPGWYVAVESEAPAGYVLDTAPQVFRLLLATGEQALYFYNERKSGSHEGGGSSRSEGGSGDDSPEPEPVPVPEIGILTLRINNGWWWNNVRTEDNGEEGYSIKVEINSGKEAGEFPFAAAGIAIALFAAGLALTYRRKRKGELVN